MIKMKLLLPVIILFLVKIPGTFAAIKTDSTYIKELDAILYCLENRNDTIFFLKTNADLQKKKPTIIFCQGSQPSPLVIKSEGTPYIPSLNFDYQKWKDYNIIILSMPHTPPVMEDSLLKNGAFYVPDLKQPHLFDLAYMADNYLDKYVERVNSVIKYLLRQPWTDKQRLYIMGHSQGAYIAVKTAARNKHIAAVAFLSGDPDGRFAQQVKEIRKRAGQKKYAFGQEMQAELNDRYSRWTDICTEDKFPAGYNGGDPAHTWKSFSAPIQKDIAEIRQPLFIAYGTEDICAGSNELLPVYLNLYNKTNYKILPLVDCGHNFEEIRDGKPDYNKMHWDDVFESFIKFIESSYPTTFPGQ